MIPYEPYYKVQASLLACGEPETLPDSSVLNLGLFPNMATATIEQIEQLGGPWWRRTHRRSARIVRVRPPQNWTALAVLPGVQIVELAHRRVLANDLARVTLGMSADTLTHDELSGSVRLECAGGGERHGH